MNMLFMNYFASKLHGSLLTVIKRTAIEKLRMATMLVYIQQKTGGIKLGRQVTRKTKFCTVATNIFGISVRNLLHVRFEVASIILGN
jgi:hypothetical protein